MVINTVDSCSCKTGASLVAHLCVGPSSSPCDCNSFRSCEVSRERAVLQLKVWSVELLIHVNAKTTSTYYMQCIDPYVMDIKGGQCSLDTDGDTIPDYRVITVNIL